MRKMVLMLMLLMTLANAVWKDYEIESGGYNKHIICKNGYLTQILTKDTNNTTTVIEQLACYDISSWNSGCKHPPIKCVNK